MSATDIVVDKALERLDNPEPNEEKPVEKVDEPKDDPKADPKADPKEDDEEEFEIDDTPDEPDEPKPKDEPKPVEPTHLNPEQKYIYDNLGTLQVRGKDGQTYNVKVPNELPADFEFASVSDQANFYAAIASQELKANKLQETFQNDAQVKASTEYSNRENQAITDDIASLQKSGDLAKFKKQPTDADFDKDPTAIQVDEIISFMNKKNESYLKLSQAGRAYRHIGFEDAFHLYKRENPEKARSAAQQEEDAQRKNVARNVGARGATPDEAPKQRAASGRQTRDLFAMIDNLDI